MPQLKSEGFTIEDIYQLPEGQRVELIDGVAYNMAPPGRIHQKLISNFTRIIGNYIENNRGDCEVYPAPFAVFVTADDKNYVEPDISVICDPLKLNEKGCYGAPDLIIEVVSESSRKMDYATKMNLYSNAGVREYWIVDPQKERTTVYRFEEDMAPIIVPFSQDLTAGIYKDLKIKVSELR
ncbi:MAG: Uma2 family endonuclease [Lachnospiraceae bacterium]|nr:Uma2 family endonuclease [Lachnospiraceae bacterium]